MRDITTAELSAINTVSNDLFDELLVNADITLYNKRTVNKVEQWQRTQIEDVSWISNKASNALATGGKIEANQATILIPEGRGANYREPISWRSNPTGTWTLQVGDIVVKGLVSDTVSSTGTFTVSDLKRTYDDVLVISSVDKLTDGTILPHWQVGAL